MNIFVRSGGIKSRRFSASVKIQETSDPTHLVKEVEAQDEQDDDTDNGDIRNDR